MNQEHEEMIAESGGNFVLPPPGNHVATCIGMTMIGTQHFTYEGHAQSAKKVILSFELSNEKFAPKEGEPEINFVIHKEYTFSMNQNGNMRKALKGWKGSDFTPEEAKAYNILRLLECSCLVNVVIVQKKDGGERADIVGLSPLPKGMDDPEMINKSFTFNITSPNFNRVAFEALPKFIKKKVEDSDEYKAKVASGQITPAAATGQAAQASSTTASTKKHPF